MASWLTRRGGPYRSSTRALMKSISSCAALMQHKTPADRRIHRLALSALVLLVAWSCAARADDALEKTARLEIAPAPLANALVQLSAESGIQIAVADVDVAHLQSKGLSGEYAIRDALQALLKDTGLSFVRVGATAVAIRPRRGWASGCRAEWQPFTERQRTRFAVVARTRLRRQLSAFTALSRCDRLRPACADRAGAHD